MGKELLLNTLRGKGYSGELPWVPFAGVHAGFLKGYSAREVLTDADKLYESLLEVHKLYTPDGMPVLFDLQIEAEILGCELMWAEDNPPSVRTHPFEDEAKDPRSLPLPKPEDGRIPIVLDVMRRMKKAVGDNTALYGLICGPLTLASPLRGSEFFMDMIEEPEYVEELMDFCADVNIKMAEYYIDAGMDVIAIVDPLVSQVSASHIEEILSPAFIKIFDYIRERGVLSSFFVCGNATSQIEVMCKTKPDSISVDENVDLVEAKKVTDQYDVVIGGNIPLTTTMLFGNQEDNMKYVVDLIDRITLDKLIISPG